MYISHASFTFKTTEDKNNFLNILKGDTGLSTTRAWKGCLDVNVYSNNDDPKHLFILSKWEDKSNHESYMNMRKETGLFEKVVSTLEGESSGLILKNLSLIGV